MNKLFATSEDFEGRLNMSIFTDFEKSMSESELKKSYPEDKFVILEKSDVDKFMNTVQAQTGGEIIKGGFNDTSKVKDVLSKAIAQLKSLKHVKVLENEVHRTVYVLEKANKDVLSKAKGNDLQKGRVTEAFGYYGGSINFTKKGKDIIDKVTILEDDLSDEMIVLEIDIANSYENLTCTPTQETYCGDTEKCPHKVFPWAMTYFESQNNNMMNDNGGSYERCNSVEEAKQNQEYNDKVHRWAECKREKDLVRMYKNNLESNKNYELTAQQMIALGF